jgi:tetratricopeptide (TPR) repeat protein
MKYFSFYIREYIDHEQKSRFPESNNFILKNIQKTLSLFKNIGYLIADLWKKLFLPHAKNSEQFEIRASRILQLENRLREGINLIDKETTKEGSIGKEDFSDLFENLTNKIFETFKIKEIEPGPKFKEFKTEKHRLETTSHLVYDLKDYLNLLADLSGDDKFGDKKIQKLKFIFVFDELDRLKGQEQILQIKEEGKSDIYRMEVLVSELKVFFTQTKANFIFVAGVDMYEKWQFEKSRGDGLYEGIFSNHIYIDSMLTSPENQTNIQKYDPQGEEIIAKLVEQYEDTLSSKAIKTSEEIEEKIFVHPSSKKESINNDPIFKLIADILKKHDVGSGVLKKAGMVDYYRQENYLEPVYHEKPTTSLESFCRYVKFKSRGIPRKVIRELNDFIVMKDDRVFIYINPRKLKKVKFFSGVEKRIQDKIPLHFEHNDINKVLLYFIIDCSFKFYKDGLSVEDWETFSIMPDQEKILISKEIYSDSIKILEKAYIERSFGRKSMYQFMPIVVRSINYLIRILPHEQHDFNFSALDYKELLVDLEKVENQLEVSGPEKRVASLRIQLQIAKIHAKLRDQTKAIDLFKKAVRIGIDEMERVLPLPESRDAFRLHHTILVLELMCEAYIEIALLYVELQSHKTAITYLWGCVRALLDFYEWIVSDNTVVEQEKGELKTTEYIKKSDQQFRVTNHRFSPTDIHFHDEEILNFINDLLSFWKLNIKTKNDVKEIKKVLEDVSKILRPEKITDKSEGSLEKLSGLVGKIIKCIDTKKFLSDKGKSYFEEWSKNSEKQNDKDQHIYKDFKEIFRKIALLDKIPETTKRVCGFETEIFLEGENKLGWLRPYMRIMGYKLRNMRIPTYFSPKLLYSINTLSGLYNKIGQTEYSRHLLITGLTAADHSSFKGNSVIQRLQLAMFHFLKLEFVEAIHYYQSAFRFINKEEKSDNWSYYMDNQMIAKIFDMLTIIALTLAHEKKIEVLKNRAIQYYLKEGDSRNYIFLTLKLIQSYQRQALGYFVINEGDKGIEKFNAAIHCCKEVLVQGRSSSFQKGNIKFSLKSVRNYGEAILRLGEIALKMARIVKEGKINENMQQGIRKTLGYLIQDIQHLLVSTEKYTTILCQFSDECHLKGTNELSCLSGVSCSNKECFVYKNYFYVLAEYFLRAAHRVFIGFIYKRESNIVPHRLGMLFFFLSAQLEEDRSNKKAQLLKISRMYLNKAVRGYKDYIDQEYGAVESLAGAYSDLGNVEAELSKVFGEDTKLKESAIKNFKQSLSRYAEYMGRLYDSLRGKEPEHRISLDSLFDTDLTSDILQKLYKRGIYSKKPEIKSPPNKPPPNKPPPKDIPNDSQKRGFDLNEPHLFEIATLLNQCVNSWHWDISMRQTANLNPGKVADSISTMNDILKEVQYFSNCLRNYGGILKVNDLDVNLLNDSIKILYKRLNGNWAKEAIDGPSKKKDADIPEKSFEENPKTTWPLGGYRYIKRDETIVDTAIENFITEFDTYMKFSG